MKTIITLDKANQPFGFPQLNANGNFNNIIVEGALSATTYQNLPIPTYISSGPTAPGSSVVTNNTSVSVNFSMASNAYVFTQTGMSTNNQISASFFVGDGSQLTNLPDNASGFYLPLSGGTVTGSTTFTNGLTANTIGSSGYCVDDVYVSNIHSCSPLNINPLDEGNVYFGSTSGVTIDLSNNRLGLGITVPTAKLDVSGKTKTINLQVTSGATNGYVLTSDANGNASWQAPTDYYVTGGTYDFTGDTLTLERNDGNQVQITGFTYERQSDYVYPYFYGGSAPLYTLTSTSIWIIKRVDYTTPGSPIIQQAIGSWDDRYILTYT